MKLAAATEGRLPPEEGRAKITELEEVSSVKKTMWHFWV